MKALVYVGEEKLDSFAALASSEIKFQEDLNIKLTYRDTL